MGPVVTTGARDALAALKVVLFSGGRGSGALARQLAGNPAISLTVAVNGYDDGLSTGEVRRFLGDALGPSDFRKNASRLARVMQTCPDALSNLVEIRLPVGCDEATARRVFDGVAGRAPSSDGETGQTVTRLAGEIDRGSREAITERLDRFSRERESSGRPFDYSDCSLGNLVFAGSFLLRDRQFNVALDDYCGLLGLPPGLVDNVTDGTNAFLVAVDLDDRLLGSEAEIVDAKRRNRIKDIFLIDRRLDAEERARLESLPPLGLVTLLDRRSQRIGLNPRIVDRLSSAGLIIYAPGTQHSSLFPSYLTPGLSDVIARNLGAIKLLITNIQTDAEIAGASAVDIIDRAVYYLKEKGRLAIPTPCLITHYLVNDPGRREPDAPYIPLGRLESLEDPRVVRVGHYEDGVSGRHDAEKVLLPFVESFLERGRRMRVAVWLYDAVSSNKVSQALVEMVRAGAADLPVSLMVYYGGSEPQEEQFAEGLPFKTVWLGHGATAASVHAHLSEDQYDYVILFECSGMYTGEDIVNLASNLSKGRLEAVWGSRRLSMRDIHESLQLQYRGNRLRRLLSAVGSHMLSAGYLSLYGRHIADTLSGARAVRASYVRATHMDPDDKLANQRLLSALLRARADLLEIPVQFFPMSPERVRRTSVFEGLRSLAMICWWRLKRPCPEC